MVLVAPGPAKPSSLPPYDIGGTLPEPRAYPGAYVWSHHAQPARPCATKCPLAG